MKRSFLFQTGMIAEREQAKEAITNARAALAAPPKNCPTRKLTLDEAIAHAESFADDTPCGQNHKQLADWLKELKESRNHHNAAAMREALVEIDELTNLLDIPEDKKNLLVSPSHSFIAVKMRRIIKKALEEPPRNCDKYSHDEALRIWSAETENERNGCFDEWLYHEATEQEGEPDGSK